MLQVRSDEPTCQSCFAADWPPAVCPLHAVCIPPQMTCLAFARRLLCPTCIDWHLSLCCSEDDSKPSEEGSKNDLAGSASQASDSDLSEEPTNPEATDEEAEADVQPDLPSYQANGGAGGQAAPPAWCSACMQHKLCCLLPAELHSATQASWRGRH